MARFTKKPTRGQLLDVIGDLQDLFGRAEAAHADDRDPNGFSDGQQTLREGFGLCVEALSFDPPRKAKKR